MSDWAIAFGAAIGVILWIAAIYSLIQLIARI